MELGHYVYLMQDKSVQGFYKIGHTYNPNLREATLLAAKPVISIVAKCRFYSDMQAKTTESDLHKKYKEYRRRGEWFELCEKKVEEILLFFTENDLTLEKEIELCKKDLSNLQNKNYRLAKSERDLAKELIEYKNIVSSNNQVIERIEKNGSDSDKDSDALSFYLFQCDLLKFDSDIRNYRMYHVLCKIKKYFQFFNILSFSVILTFFYYYGGSPDIGFFSFLLLLVNFPVIILLNDKIKYTEKYKNIDFKYMETMFEAIKIVNEFNNYLDSGTISKNEKERYLNLISSVESMLQNKEYILDGLNIKIQPQQAN